MPRQSLFVRLILCLLACPTLATAGTCDAYFTFDDTLADAGGNGYDGEMIMEGGELAAPAFTDGKFGQALMLDGNAAMRSLLDLHYDACPQVTISAWIKVARDAPGGSLHVLSTGGGGSPGLTISGTGLILHGTENGIYQQQAIRKGSWMFVAGVYDYEMGVYALHLGSRPPLPGTLSKDRAEPQNAFWVGTVHDDWGLFAQGVAIDDLRITGQTLDAQQLAAFRNQTAATSESEAIMGSSNVDLDRSPDLTTDLRADAVPVGPVWAGAACTSTDECFGGSYCGLDQMCHPEKHAPMTVSSDALPAPDPGSANEEEYTGGFHPGDTAVTSALSGFSGNVVDTIDLRDDFYNQIVWARRGLQPCRISVRRTGTGGQTRTLEYCEHTDAHHVAVSGAIRRLRVCTPTTTRKIRGLQVWEAEIHSTGRADTSSTDTTFIEGCSRWHEEVSCPAGHLATGLEVHATTVDSDFEHLVGLRLVCREVVRDFP